MWISNFQKLFYPVAEGKKWRDDGICGSSNSLLDGEDPGCDPGGENPCCSDNYSGECGNTAEHCTCEDCTNYTRIYREWEESGGTQMWRYDGMCGSYNPLPNGTAAQCDPEGENPCCGDDAYARCRNTARDCQCNECTDYKLKRDWEDSGGKQKWRYDRRCGSKYPLPDGTAAQCDPKGENPCCNDRWKGECGSTAEHCSCKSCTDFNILYNEWKESGGTQMWRSDGNCGVGYPLPNGTAAQCDPNGEKPCCDNDDEYGRCRNTAEYDCHCYSCTDYKLKKDWEDTGGKQMWRYDGKCGSDNPLPDGTAAQCDPDGENPCCNNLKDGECGNTTKQCTCLGCIDYRVTYREWRESGGTQRWRNDGMCGSGYPLPDGTATECDPDGYNPCCNDSPYIRECGNTTEHCSCGENCTDYKFFKDWRESNGTLKWRNDGKCGWLYPLPDGTRPTQCDPDGDKPCCSDLRDGTCSHATYQYCDCPLCTDYKFLKLWRESNEQQKWRYDGKCGSNYPLPDGTPAQCDPEGGNPCCNDLIDGECGHSTWNCSCNKCTDYKILKDWRESDGKQKWRWDGKCGEDNPLPDYTAAQCDPDGANPCCDYSWKGLCRSYMESNNCTCDRCVDYKTIYREWEESNGLQKWRYDGKCGSFYPLPDGTPAQCDPEGRNPCCNPRKYSLREKEVGRCGNTTDFCSCYHCTDFKALHNETNKRNRWRYDGKCGIDYPLADGSPAECDPDGKKPCCRDNRYCDEPYNDYGEHCFCADCVDYRYVREIRKSGEECAPVRLETGYLKNVCFDEEKRIQYFKCTHSGESYRTDLDSGGTQMVFPVCKNDSLAYQACGFTSTPITDKYVLCGGYFCENEKYDLGKFIDCSGDNKRCVAENRNCDKTPRNTTDIANEVRCDGKCDIASCEDESKCNGYEYGIFCSQERRTDEDDNVKLEYIPVSSICDGKYMSCYYGLDEQDCYVADGITDKCVKNNGEYSVDIVVIVPILNYTRCSVFDEERGIYPYCKDYRDQTNCTDVRRVGGYCKVGGYMSSISKNVLCRNLSTNLCEDDLPSICYTPYTKCTLHKHRMCDKVEDCSDGSDEAHDMCAKMTDQEFNFTCQRRFQDGLDHSAIPLSWIMDEKLDCMDGEDENSTLWKLCPGEIKQIASPKGKCQNFFKCSKDANGSVQFDQLCDGVESCDNGIENSVCNIARDFPSTRKVAPYINSTLRDVCNDANSCETKEFQRPGGPDKVFGVDRTLSVPKNKISCRDLFGEHYVFLSCMGLCSEENATCPLGNHSLPRYDSCPEQFPNRTWTIADNSFLTFVEKNSNGRYHHDFYQCKNTRCIEFHQMCDLFDDCGDMSDEINCSNHLICENTLNSTKHQFIALSQRCDGIYDCFDLSDECNDGCGKEILGNWMVKITCCFMGILATLFNLMTVLNGVSSLKDSATEQMLISMALMTLIGFGDFLIGLYLVILSVYDSIVFGKEFCKYQTEWMTGTPCMTLGVISTLGSQISLFTMTVLSVIRMYGLTCAPMRVPGPANKRSILKVASLAMLTVSGALIVAVTPLMPFLEDYFVQGMFYDESYKVFIGFPNKEKHIKVLEAYYREQVQMNSTENDTKIEHHAPNISSQMSWTEIGERVDAMFSQDNGLLTRKPVHFYGNDGNCLFKYFVRTDDARRSRNATEGATDFQGDPVVWTMLAVNFVCFVVITCCYIVITIKTKKSSQSSGQNSNPERKREERAIQNKIKLIIATDFICWIPFIVMSALHNLNYIDVSSSYSSFAMTVLPLNSVINPLVYDKVLVELMKRAWKKLKKTVTDKLAGTTLMVMIKRLQETSVNNQVLIISLRSMIGLLFFWLHDQYFC